MKKLSVAVITLFSLLLLAQGALAAARGWALRELRLEKKSLEDIFVSLTRDDPEGAAP